ncbi:hypothetical protein VNO80_16112 [Phaseolus coccineus]|uniref:Uncharacterized protein n=1 Tax=Phaseolus coccineus TaxID=3886 RepID=A0AAN9MR26_PHACN
MAKVLHEISEVEPGLVVGVTVGLEKEGLVLEEAGDLAAIGEFELSVELVGDIEADDVLRLGGEELLRCMMKRRRVTWWRMHSRKGMHLGLGLRFFLNFFRVLVKRKEVENGVVWEIGLGFRVFEDLMVETTKTKKKHTGTAASTIMEAT